MNRLILSSIATLMLAATAGAQDWPQWRGPHRDARAVGVKAPETWPKALAEKWSVTVGEGVATPALVGDKLYVFSREGGNEVTRCLDASSGKELWRNEYASMGAGGAASSFSGPRSSPAVADGKVVTLGVRGMLSCLEAATGKELWRKDDFGEYPRFHPSSSPLIVDGLVIAQLGGGDNGAVVAYGLATGDQKWKWSGASPAYASPALLVLGGRKFVVAQTEAGLVAVNAADGTLAWQSESGQQEGERGGGGRRGGRGGARDYKAATPVVDGATVIFAGLGVKALNFTLDGDRLVPRELWRNAETSVQFNTPVLKDGFLYGLSPRDEFFCLNARNGELAWTAPWKPSEGGAEQAEEGRDRGRGGRGGRGGARPGFGSVVDLGPVLAALTSSSELVAFKPSDKEFQEVARIKVAPSPTYAYPVFSGDHVFVKDQEKLMLLALQ